MTKTNKSVHNGNINERLYKVALAICLLCFLLPYIITNELIYPHVTGRNLLFRILVGGSAGIVFYYYACRRGLLLLKSKITLLFVGFIFVKIIAALFSYDTHNSFYSSLIRMDGVLFWGYLFLFYLLLIVVMSWEQGSIILLRFTTALASIAVLFLIFRWLSDTSVVLDRQSFTFGNPAFFGTHMLFHLGFSIYLIFKEKRRLLKWTWIFSALLCFVGLIMSGTRASILGVVISMVVVFVFGVFRTAQVKSYFNLKNIVIAAVIGFGGLFLVSSTSLRKLMPAVDRIENTSLSQKEIRTRLGAWNIGVEGWKERPLLGWGDSNYAYVYHKYNQRNDLDNWLDKSHNHLVEVLVANGLIGCIIYLILISAIVRSFFLEKNDMNRYILGGIFVAWFFQNLFIFDTINSYLYLMLLFALSVNRKSDELPFSESKSKLIIPAILVSSIALCITFYLYLDVYHSAKYLKTANDTLSLSDYRKALSTDNLSNKETTIFLLANIQTMMQSSDIDSRRKLELIDFALQSADTQLEKSPHDIKLLILSSRLYQSVAGYKGEYASKAEKIIIQAKELAPYRTDVSNLHDKILE